VLDISWLSICRTVDKKLVLRTSPKIVIKSHFTHTMVKEEGFKNKIDHSLMACNMENT